LKNTTVTAKQRYIEQRTPKSDEYLKELAFLGIDMGNKIKNENIVPQNIVPVLLIEIQLGIEVHSLPIAVSGHL
jgi:hypothetical protein